MRSNPTGTVSGWDGDPGPAGYLNLEEIDGHFIISCEQWPQHYFRLCKNEGGLGLTLVGKRGDPGPAGQFVIEDMGGYLLISSRQWPQQYLFIDEMGRTRAEESDPGCKGHFLVNQKVKQDYDGVVLPDIIQAMYLMHDKEAVHTYRMRSLCKQKDEARASEVGALLQQKDSEREVAVLAAMKAKDKERADALVLLTEQKNRELAVALHQRDMEHAAAMALLAQQKDEARRAEVAALSQQRDDFHNITLAATIKENKLEKERLVADAVRRQTEDYKAIIAEKDAGHKTEVESLTKKMSEEKRTTVFQLSKEKEAERIAMLNAAIQEKEQEYSAALWDASKHEEQIKNELNNLLLLRTKEHEEALAAQEERHQKAMTDLEVKLQNDLALAVAQALEVKQKEFDAQMGAVVTNYEAEGKKDKGLFKMFAGPVGPEKEMQRPRSGGLKPVGEGVSLPSVPQSAR